MAFSERVRVRVECGIRRFVRWRPEKVSKRDESDEGGGEVDSMEDFVVVAPMEELVAVVVWVTSDVLDTEDISVGVEEMMEELKGLSVLLV
jgi:hypothetical protein